MSAEILRLASSAEVPVVDESGFESMPAVMSPKVLAEQLDVSTKTLERWRLNNGGKGGPVCRQLPGTKLYRYYRRDVIAWLDTGPIVSGTVQTG